MLIKHDNTVNSHQGECLTKLQGVYSLEYNCTARCYFLRETQPFKLPNKIYGLDEIERDCKNWLEAFSRASKNIGISLVGVKGAGKTITAQYLCNLSGKPVILVPHKVENTEAFFEFMTAKEIQDSVVFIDEFEKVFGTYR